ncbi:anhydro-N-acetylmuramic acid kinase [Arachidicoccus terrestris]|uniref:anhydro-N-acetylmuramic acid kinase n=1 Tax=Arachidicoccus terrestris TaxID=2875539 RepID=UPI001CC4C9F2|nr:anhydro-N-acetylmuramic acid kinase [Arachidicoccus terrestris]UAY56685.1 anhydro-N-acetylmuramic acid kinase [Arachidicoccus terrestris]
MVYRAIGLMSGSSLDGLDIAFVSFEEVRGQWTFDLRKEKCVHYSEQWKDRLKNAADLSAREFVQLDYDLGLFIGKAVQQFIVEHALDHQIQLIVNHGHTIFHEPEKGVTTQIGSAAAIAAINSINVIDQLRVLDVALGGQGAPLVPLGEQLLFPTYDSFLNIGGIANIAFHQTDNIKAFDVTVANQALNYLASLNGTAYDQDGQLAAAGQVNTPLLTSLNKLPYCSQPAPKSLANQFFTTEIKPLLDAAAINIADKLRTVVEHIAMQVGYATGTALTGNTAAAEKKMLITGGGAHNTFLVNRIKSALMPYGIQVELPDARVIDYKEAIIMALLGVLRWREENTVMENTGASRPSIGGAVWIGQPY